MITAALPAGFWQDLPGLFLGWNVEDAVRAHPGATVRLISPTRGVIAGFVPARGTGQVVELVVDDEKARLA